MVCRPRPRQRLFWGLRPGAAASLRALGPGGEADPRRLEHRDRRTWPLITLLTFPGLAIMRQNKCLLVEGTLSRAFGHFLLLRSF